jgi:hypothetical protein
VLGRLPESDSECNADLLAVKMIGDELITLIHLGHYFARYAPTMLAQASTKSCSDLVNVPSK